MLSRKTVSTFILCFAVVISTWLFTRQAPKEAGGLATNTQVSAKKYRNISETNDQWRTILGNVPVENDAVTDLTKSTALLPEDTSLTSHVAKDVFSLYLMSTKTGEPFTAGTANQIAGTILENVDRNDAGAAVYISSNLKIGDKSRSTFNQYRTKLNEVILTRMMEIKDVKDPIAVVTAALQSENDIALTQIDPIIKSNKVFITDLLAMTVPGSAVRVHLGLLNASSLILTDLEALRNALSDPIRTLSVLGKYNEHISGMLKALSDVNNYLAEN